MDITTVWDTTKNISDLMHTKCQGSTRWSVLNCKYCKKSLKFLQWERWIYLWILCKNSSNFKSYDCSWWENGTNLGGCKDTEIINKKVQLCCMLHWINVCFRKKIKILLNLKKVQCISWINNAWTPMPKMRYDFLILDVPIIWQEQKIGYLILIVL